MQLSIVIKDSFDLNKLVLILQWLVNNQLVQCLKLVERNYSSCTQVCCMEKILNILDLLILQRVNCTDDELSHHINLDHFLCVVQMQQFLFFSTWR